MRSAAAHLGRWGLDSEKGRKVEYLVHWQGFSMKEATWEPPSNCQGCDEILSKFEEEQSKKVQNPSANT